MLKQQNVEDKLKSKKRLKYFYMKAVQEQVDKRLDSLRLEQYLDLTIKSIYKSKFVQTKDRYILTLNKDETTFFDLRKRCLELLFLKLKNHHSKNMMILDLVNLEIHIYKI